MTTPDTLLLAAGLVLCCAGSTLFQGLIALPGFLIGVAGGILLLRGEGLGLALGGGLLLGIVGAVLALVVARLVIFACGAGAGAGLAYVLGPAVLGAEPSWLLLAASALVVGVLALWGWRLVAVAISSIAGAVLLSMALRREDPVWVGAFAAVGVAVQYALLRRARAAKRGG